MQSLRARLQRWKAEVEQRWMPDEPKKDGSKASLKATARARRREREEERKARAEEEEEEEDEAVRRAVDIPAEEVLGVVDFFSDDEKEEGMQSDGEDEPSEEERRKREEEEDWATLEAGDDGDDPPQSPLLPLHNGDAQHSEADAQEAVDEQEWAELEGAKDEEEAKVESAPTRPPSMRKGVPSFPKRSVMEWFEDEEEDDDGPLSAVLPSSAADGAEGRMQALSSALVSSTSEFHIRPAYEGRSGQRLLQMKRGYAGDSRFALDDRFADAAKDEEVEHKVQREEEEEGEENEGQLGTRMDDSGKGGRGEPLQQQRDAELKQALHAETARALQLLDEVAPGPSRFHQTLPRFAALAPSTQAGGAADADKDAQAMESELNAAEVKKAVLLWRRTDRFDPDLEDRKQRKAEQQKEDEQTQLNHTTAARTKIATTREEGKRTVRRVAEQAAVGPSEMRVGEGEEEEQLRFSRSFSVDVPRLRDLVTDPSTVVQFSFAVDADPHPSSPSSPHADAVDVQTNIDTATPFPTKPAPSSQPPLVAAPVGLSSATLLLRRGGAHLPIPSRTASAAAPPPPLVPATAAGERPRSLRDLLALAAAVHEGKGGGRGVGGLGVGVAGGGGLGGEEDEEEEGGFVRGEADEVEAAWLRSREAIRVDYRRKSREASKKEALKQSLQQLHNPAKRKRKEGGAGGAEEGAERGGKRGGTGAGRRVG